MSRQNLELLAPAGTPAVLETVVNAGADAVYLGGKRFNMRLLRPEFNFSDQELSQAVKYLHDRDKKLYITVNNLYKQQELDDIKEYLLFLSDLQVDALIIQDLGLIQRCQEMNIKIPLHASVQMGINNLESVRVLENHGFSRVILSKNLNLKEIEAIHASSHIGIEFFAHGDLCVSHTGQCFLSSFLFGESGNRGRCRKPCRWSYRLDGLNLENSPAQYYLAHKDLCLYPHLADLIKAGVQSFKIEGRMRSAEQLGHIIRTYRQALDACIADPSADLFAAAGLNELYEKRIRDFTSASLFRPTNSEDIGLSGEREPVFPTAPIPLISMKQVNEKLVQNEALPVRMPELTVAVGDLESLQNMLDMGVDNLILGMDSMRQCALQWNPATIRQALDKPRNGHSKIFIETPRIVSQEDLIEIYKLAEQVDTEKLDGFIVNDLGSLRILQSTGLKLWTGYGLNISNVSAGAFLKTMGAERITAALEIKEDDLSVLLQAGIPMELLVQGPLPGMISDLCMISSATAADRNECLQECVQAQPALLDEYGQAYKIYTDIKCRNYLYHPYERCLYPYLVQLIAGGPRSLRIDGQYYSPELLVKVVSIYQQTLFLLQEKPAIIAAGWNKLLELFPNGLTSMPLF